jgi:hypothetical protein
MEKIIHPDGSLCLEGTKNVPPNFVPCCKVFNDHTITCTYDLRYEWYKNLKSWVIKVSNLAGISITFCPHCGKKL